MTNSDKPDRGEARVLIVDDQPKNLQLLGNILSKENIKNVFAIDGVQALKSVAYNPPDLILLDISMPEMDGFEVCERIQKDPDTRHIPVIFLTARNQSEDIIRGFETGAVDYITKPFNPTELTKRVTTHLKVKQSQDIIKLQNIQLREINSLLDAKNDELDEKNKELSATNAAKDRMFSIIAHDLRGPVGNFKTVLNMLLEHGDYFSKEKTQEMLEMLQEVANSTFNLLENLLQWSRSQRDDLLFEPETIVLKDIVGNAFELLQSNAKQKNISLIHTIADDFEMVADKNMITTVIRNLVSNAIKFTKEKGKIEIFAGINNDSVEVTVKDNGVGMEKEVIEKIFSENRQYTTNGTNNEKGSGLGLPLCKEFIKKHNGTLWAESEPDKGSRFTFRLPKTQH